MSKVRLEVSFELPKGMSKKQAGTLVRNALLQAMHSDPAIEPKAATLKIQIFAVP